MTNVTKQPVYEDISESEQIWENLIKGGDFNKWNRSLLKAIGKEELLSEEEDIPVGSTQMWDGDNWVAFDLSKAYYLINDKKIYIQLRIYKPLQFQPEYGPTIKGWGSIDSSYINESLREKECKKSVIESVIKPHLDNIISMSENIKERHLSKEEWYNPSYRKRGIKVGDYAL